MNRDELFSKLSCNQRKLVEALLDNPQGLLSNELAELTGVSNKGATMTKEVRALLTDFGLDLIIERTKGVSKWIIVNIECEVAITESALIKTVEALERIAEACQDIKRLLATDTVIY